MRKTWLILLLLSLVFACNIGNNNEDETNVQDVDNETQLGATESEEVEDESKQESLESILSKLSVEQRNVYDDMFSFVKWYIENRDSLFAKRERIVESNAANVASINLEYVEDYLNFLKQEGKSYLSMQFVQNEEKYWQAAYKETTEKQIIWEDGPDPWSFEVDPIFNGQERPDDFDRWKEEQNGEYRELNPSDIEVKGDTATVFFNLRRKVVKEAGRWKLVSW